jgi:hypothetical protein
MSQVKISGNASGTGIFTIASPNSNSNQTLTLPDSTGTIATSADLSSLNASNLTSGTVPTARLATGTADSTTYLRGDSTWATVTAGIAAQNCSYTGTVVESGSFSTTGGSVTVDLGSNRVVTGIRTQYVCCGATMRLRGFNIKNTA